MKELIRGLPASPGKVHGRARIILPSTQGQRLKPGEILIALMTDPSMFVDIIENAKAVITDRGGLTSHPAIVSRELGIPCVVGTHSATTVLRDGMRIFVDGDEGIIYESD